MNEKEEKNIDLEQILEEERSRLKGLSDGELVKASGGTDNGVVFKKGKWIKDYQDKPEHEYAYELLELQGDEILANMWVKSFARVHCLRDMLLPLIILQVSIEIPRPDWAHE